MKAMLDRKKTGMPWVMLGIATLMGFAMWVPMFAIPPMEHIITAELGLTHTQIGLLYTIPLLMTIAIPIPAGILADKIGLRKTAGIGAIMIAAGTALRGLAVDAPSLIGFTFLYGLGYAWVFPNLPKLVSAWVPREKANIGTGVFSSGFALGVGLGLAITMPFIYPITNTYQGTLLIWSIPSVVAAILWWTVVKDSPSTTLQNEEASEGGDVPFSVIIRNRNLWLIATLLLLTEFFFFTWAGWAPTLLIAKGASVENAGLITSISMWAGIPTCFLMPRLSEKLGVRRPFIWGAAGILLAVAWWILHVPLYLVWLPMILLGIADLTRYVNILALPVEIMPHKHVGRASGLVLCIGAVGGFIGPIIGGHILDMTGSLNQAFVVLAVIAAATIAVTFLLPETGPRVRRVSNAEAMGWQEGE